ncbi:galactose oxidase [Rickenella mellea]|uniref:Galactose oxidase n=1 Tax=Rickenella mellea TaxID=50990 RepID=A0A4R5XH78_9AGAM|nr:galactose oxidase [Rickenella mellea]
MPVAQWTRLARSVSLPRSSHCLAISSQGTALLYGGELKPRTPVDVDQKGVLHTFQLQSTEANDAWQTIQASTAIAPDPRVGAAATAIGDYFYVWGGRGGADMAPIGPPQAGIWRASLKDGGPLHWERVTAVNENEAPQPRSYHAIAFSSGKVYIHAGCPASGRLNDLYSFDVENCRWDKLDSAPGLARGGTALALATVKGESVFLRFAGFSGYELGEDHTLDIYNISMNSWRTITPTADPSHGFPGPRSVHGFVGFKSSKFPKAVALLYHGERDASTLGHQGAGTFWSDVWMLEEAGDNLAWKCVTVPAGGPDGCGWFPSASWISPEGETKIIMHGGLLSSNERSDELWFLSVEE